MTAERAGTINPVQSCMPEHNVDSNYSAETCVCTSFWVRGKGKHKTGSGIPPWQQKIFSSTIAATGKQLKQSVKVFHSLMLYRLLPVKAKSQTP